MATSDALAELMDLANKVLERRESVRMVQDGPKTTKADKRPKEIEVRDGRYGVIRNSKGEVVRRVQGRVIRRKDPEAVKADLRARGFEFDRMYVFGTKGANLQAWVGKPRKGQKHSK